MSIHPLKNTVLFICAISLSLLPLTDAKARPLLRLPISSTIEKKECEKAKDAVTTEITNLQILVQRHQQEIGRIQQRFIQNNVQIDEWTKASEEAKKKAITGRCIDR